MEPHIIEFIKYEDSKARKVNGSIHKSGNDSPDSHRKSIAFNKRAPEREGVVGSPLLLSLPGCEYHLPI